MSDNNGQQMVTAPRAAWELEAALAAHSVPVDDRDGVSVAQFLQMAAARTWRYRPPWTKPERPAHRGPGSGGR